jgi:hypothetical protein
MKVARIMMGVAAALLAAASASAQAPSVGASLFGDVVRTTHSDTADVRGNGGGEAIGFALRAGTRIGSAWGVEVEFARPAEIEEEGGGPIALPAVDLPSIISFPRVPTGIAPAIFPPITIAARTSQRHTTLAAVAWAEQQLTARVSLVYLGGVTFARSQRGYSYTYSPLAAGLPGLSILPPPFGSETVSYGVGPVVGFESRLSLTDRAQLVPGIRLHAIDNTWLVRPSVGISWSF